MSNDAVADEGVCSSSSSNDDKKKKEEKIQIYRLTKTATLFLSWICLGLYNEVIGPTLHDLKTRSGSNYEEISRVLSARSAGLFLGSIIGGAVHDHWARRRDLVLAVALLMSALTITIAPWCTSLWLLGIIFHVMGHSHGLLTTGANPTLAILWAERSAGPYNFMHAGFGLGGTIGPLMSKPFMSPSSAADRDEEQPLMWNETMNTTSLNTSIMFHSDHSTIEVPYGIVGLLCAAMSLVFIVFSVRELPREFTPKEIPWREIVQPKTCARGQTGFGLQMLLLIFLYYMFVVGGERAFGKFVFSYAVDSTLRLTKLEASWLTAAYWSCYTIARLLVFAFSRIIPIRILLIVETSGTLLTAILINIFPDNIPAFWILTMSFGFFKSPLFPSCLGWANRYIDMNSMTIMCVNVGSSTGGMLVQWLTGYLFEYHGPKTFLYLIVSYSAAIFVLFLVMDRVASANGDKYSRAAAEEEVKVNVVSEDLKVISTNNAKVRPIDDEDLNRKSSDLSVTNPKIVKSQDLDL